MVWVPGDCFADGLAGGELSCAVSERFSAGESTEGDAAVPGREPGLSECVGDDAVCGFDRAVDRYRGRLPAAAIHTTSQPWFREGQSFVYAVVG